MAEFNARQWELAVLRVRLDVTGSEPVVGTELVDYSSGKDRQLWHRHDAASDFGLTDDGRTVGDLRVPEALADRVSASLHGELQAKAALWIRLVPPYGYLGAVPWEDLVDKTALPVLRIPDRLPVPTDFGSGYAVAVAVNAGGRPWGARHVREFFDALGERIGTALQMDVFADRVTSELLGTSAEPDPRLRIHPPGRASAVHAQRVREGVTQFRAGGTATGSPNLLWADWIADGLAGRAVRALHVAADATFDSDLPLLTIAADPDRPRGRRDCGLVTDRDLGGLADALGASLISLGSPLGNPADAATRMIADSLGQNRPGPTLYSCLPRDDGARALAELHAFLFAATRDMATPVPVHPSLFGYLQPEAIPGLIGPASRSALTSPEHTSSEISGGTAPADWSDYLARVGITIAPTDDASVHFQSADEVPVWVAASTRFIDQQMTTLESSTGPATPAVTSKQAYDQGSRQALDLIRDLVNRFGGNLMTRTVVNFGRLGSSTYIRLERNDGANIDTDARMIRIGALTGTDARARGQELMRLLHRHRPVKEAMQAALNSLNGTRALYFHVESHVADQLPWEQLYGERGVGFCALNPRSPIGRVARQFNRLEPRGYVDQLTIVAVLSAAGRSGGPQLRALIDAVNSPEGGTLGARLHVISGEKAVLDAARAAGPAVTTEEIASDGAGVARQIARARPTIVHLLCHGSIVQGVRTLFLATAGDYLAGSARGESALKLEMLVDAINPCNPWLVVLAACATAATDDGPALAHELVNQGVPAVIGMRRLVDIGETDRFCDAFYERAMPTLATTLAAGDRQLRELDWAGTVTAARQAVSGDDPIQKDTWSDPVLYVQSDALTVFRPVPNGMSLADFSAIRGELDTLSTHRAQLDPHTQQAVLTALDARITELTTKLAEAGL